MKVSSPERSTEKSGEEDSPGEASVLLPNQGVNLERRG